MPHLPALSAALLSISLLLGAPAWAVYKCESGGQINYSDTACTDGKTLEIYDSKGAPGVTSGQSATDKADKQQAIAQAKLERESARAKLVEEKHKRKCAQLAQRKKWAEEDLRSASFKNQEKARRKSQRANDQYLAECPA